YDRHPVSSLRICWKIMAKSSHMHARFRKRPAPDTPPKLDAPSLDRLESAQYCGLSGREDALKFKVLGAFGSEGQGQRPSAFLVDDHLLVDAGTVGGALSVAEQIEIEHAVISHAHLDHTAGLAFLTDTLAMVAPERRVTVTSIAPVIESLRTHAFNDALWPNFTTIPSGSDPVLGFRTLREQGESHV